MKELFASAPLVLVSDLARSLDYYCDVLGFERPKLWGDPPAFAMPQRDGLIVMLALTTDAAHVRPNHAATGNWDAYFWVRDARALFDEFAAKGARVYYEPMVQESYGNLEFAVLDPDGYLLAFGQEGGGDPA